MDTKLTVFKPTHPEPAPPDGVVTSEWTVGHRTITVIQHVDPASKRIDVAKANHGDPRDLPVAGVGTLRHRWKPDVPTKLSRSEWRQYAKGRARHYQRVANIMGKAVALAEPHVGHARSTERTTP